MPSSQTQPFAQVFAELIPDDAVLLVAVGQVEAFVETLASDKSIHEVLVSPALPRSTREGLLRRALEGLDFHEVTVKTMVMMIRKNVIAQVRTFFSELREIADERCGIARGLVSTAVDLSRSSQETIEKMVSKSLGKEVSLLFKTDPDLLGGVSLRMRELELDASYRKHLQEAKSKLKKIRA
jgi:F-type H+-transporting ATPase subunit delta